MLIYKKSPTFICSLKPSVQQTQTRFGLVNECPELAEAAERCVRKTWMDCQSYLPIHGWWDECHSEQEMPAEAVPAEPQRQQHAALLQIIP